MLQSEKAISETKEIIALFDLYKEKIKGIETPIILKIINDIFTNPFISISKFQKENKYNYNTVKSNIQRLEKNNIIQKVNNGKNRGVLYCCNDLKKILIDRGIEENEMISLFIG